MTMRAETTEATGRQKPWVYRVNMVVLVIVGTLVIGAALYLSTLVKKKWDFTSNKIYSLSTYTQQLLKQVDDKKLKFELISLFPGSREESTQVDDLLEEYARASANVTTADLSSVDQAKLTEKIRERYAGEIKPYEETIGEYKKVLSDLEKFSKLEAANFAGLSQAPDATPESKRDLAQLQGLFASALPTELSRLRRSADRQMESTSPNWTSVATQLRTALDDIEHQFALFANTAQIKEAVSAPTAKYFEGANDRYRAIDEELKGYVAKLTALKPLKVQEVLDSLGANTVVVLSPTSATVVPSDRLFKDGAPAGRGQPAARSFEGEQAVSSAILSIVQPEKVKVVFITTTPTHPTTSQGQDGWGDVTDRLKAANFDVSEWAPAGQPQPGQPPEPSEPPASGKGVVWIVFPPEPVNPQMMMMGMPPPNPQPVIDAVKKHMDAGGQAMFLAEAGMPSSPFSPGGGEYPFAQMLAGLGIEVQSKYMVVHNYTSQDGSTQLYPRVAISRYPDTEITKPLQSLQTVMMGFPNQQSGGMMGAPTVVSVAKSAPADVETQVILESPSDADTWGETEIKEGAKFDKGIDLAAPLPLGVTAVRNKGKENEQRVVVFGSKTIGWNYLVSDIVAARDESGGLVALSRNPGNAELLNNAVLWLAGYKNMISVSSKSAAAMRIRDIPPVTLGIWRFMLWVGFPMLALALGGVVWLFRRR